MRLTLEEMAQALVCGVDRIVFGAPGRLAGKQTPVDAESALESWREQIPCGASIDSRLVKPGMLFFCLKGERHDGHDFILEALKKGASAIIADHHLDLNPDQAALMAAYSHVPLFLVDNVQHALIRLARCHRETSLAKVIGVTGTAGKTTVKEVLVHVLSMHAYTAYSKDNQNNQIGLPLSMLNASAEASYWVMELGISQEQDMDDLGSLLQPDIALVLNVGAGHAQGLGKRGVAFHKASIFLYLQPGGIAVYSLDYPELVAEVKSLEPSLLERGIRLFRFSTQREHAECVGSFAGSEGDTGHFLVKCEGANEELSAPFSGPYGAENVAAVIAVARSLDVPFYEIIRGLAEARLPGQRFFSAQVDSFTIIDDSYNANPLSMRRMLETAALKARQASAPLYLVLGEMGELGELGPSSHYDLGKQIAELGAEIVFWKGGFAAKLQEGLRDGKSACLFYPVSGGQEFSALLEELKLERGIILFKGSRVNQLERLVEMFTYSIKERGGAYAL